MIRKPRVLIAGSHFAEQKLIRDLPGLSHCDIVMTDCGREALRIIMEEEKPDLVILNNHLAQLDGITVCRRLKEDRHTRRIPILVIPSGSDVEDKIQVLQAGADDYLLKPFQPAELTARVNAILRAGKLQVNAQRHLVNDQINPDQLGDSFQTQEQAFSDKRMAELGQLVGGIAHEINNPLSFILNNTGICREIMENYHRLLDFYQEIVPTITDEEILKRARELEEEIDYPYLKRNARILNDDIRDGLNRIRGIISDLKSFARKEPRTPEQVDLVECLERTLNLLNHQTRNIRIIREYDRVPLVECFPNRVNQVFLNVLLNAVQAMDGKGSILTRAYHEEETTAVCIQITDEGGGIPADVMSRIFEPFFTTKAEHGTGLGLSISLEIIRNHGGDMIFSSEEGKGTTCLIRLPLKCRTPHGQEPGTISEPGE